MKTTVNQAETIDSYIDAAPPAVRTKLRKIREVIRKSAPDAEEIISYRMPAFRGNNMLVYFAAFKSHIGMFPPVTGDARLNEALARYKGPKGNLRFPLDEPIPLELIERIVKLRVQQDSTAARKRNR